MSKIEELLNKLSDNAPATVDIPGKNEEVFRCKALLLKKDSPLLELIFPPDSWNIEELKVGANCSVSIDQHGVAITIIARLDGATSDRRLLFTAREPVSVESLRDFFRVNINTAIQASYIAGPKEVKYHSWKMIGTTIDLSGSGVLAMFAEKPPNEHRIILEITPPEDADPIFCLANVIRSYRIRKNRYQVAFHFTDISSKTRDQIISCCLKEQRRQLRENVETL